MTIYVKGVPVTIPEGESVKGVTQAEYDAMTPEEKEGFFVITDANPSVLGRYGEIYSENEMRIGTWVDGKPLYRVVVQGVAPSAVNVQSSYITSFLISSETIVCFTGIFRLGIQSIPFNHIGTRCFVQEDEICIFLDDSAFVNRPFYATIEYTKTTDEPEVSV